MKVELVAFTQIAPNLTKYMTPDENAGAADTLAEFAGRACYQSFNKPNPATRSNADYLANIQRQAHESVLEHASMSVYVQGVSRNMLLELERHRHISFSVVSTRFVDATKATVIVPPALRPFNDRNEVALDSDIIERYLQTVDILVEKGATRKQAREAARWMLPGNLETKFVVTGNYRAWRDVIKKRYSVHADAEIREFAGRVLQIARQCAPHTMQDISTDPTE